MTDANNITEMVKDLSHTGELSMLYRCAIADALTALQADLAAAVARAEAAEGRVREMQQDRPFIIGANHGWDEATEQMAAHFDSLSVLRKMWSAREVSEIIRRLVCAALPDAAAPTEYEQKVAQMKEDFPNGV